MSDLNLMPGHRIKCTTCDGHGQVRSWSFGVEEPDECRDCGGSGVNWQYPRGAVAQYFGGPFLGLIPASQAINKDSTE